MRPVRSLRDASASLREEWQGALAFGSTMGAGYLRRRGAAEGGLRRGLDIVDIRRGGLGAAFRREGPFQPQCGGKCRAGARAADSIARPFAFLQESAVPAIRECL